jgi:diguanylate cyclase (GGDEF)-like protein/PAS domain S-box-containing protein
MSKPTPTFVVATATPTPTDPYPRPALVQAPVITWWSNPDVIARVAIAFAIVIGVLSLVGWMVGVPELRALGPSGRAAMNPMTAACLVALGSGLWLVAHDEVFRGRQIARALGFLVLVVGAARLYGMMTADGFGADTLLFGDAMKHTADGRDNRMSFNSAINFFLLGGALLLQLRRSRFASGLAQLLAVLVLFSAQAALIAHAYQSGWFESVGAFNKMALPTAVAFAALGIAFMTMSSNDGLIAIVLSEGPGGSLARTLLPAGFLVPTVLGWLLIFGRRGSLIDPDLADTIFVLATILIFVGIVAWIATKLHESHLDRVKTEDALRESEVRFRLIAENGSDVVSLYSTEGRIIYISPSCERVLGFLPEEMPRMAPFAMVHPQDLDRLQRHFNQLLRGEPVASIQVRMMHKTGRHLWLEMMWRSVLDDSGQVTQLQVSSRDITDSKQNERRLEDAQRKLQQQQDMLHDANSKLTELAAVDGLTQLRNRRAFQERLEDETRRWRRHGNDVSLVLLDIDHFKSYNDSFGHPKGDEVLRAVGRLLRRSLRASDFPARYGGEEFAIILPNTNAAGSLHVAETLRRAIEGATWEDRAITASIGVATMSDEISTADDLVDAADRALYRSKQAGRNCVTAGVE